MRVIWFFLVVLILKFTINLSKYLRAKRYLERYMRWLIDKDEVLIQSKAQMIQLLKDADVSDSYVGFVEPMGFMQVRTGNASVFANLFNSRMDIVTLVNSMFNQAIGTYRARMIETFNPLYWLEAAINMPKHLSKYLGVSQESVLIKLAQLVWWVTAAAIGFIYTLYKPQVESIIKGWLVRLTN